MRKTLLLLLTSLLFLLFSFIASHQAFSQVYSKGINSNGATLGYLDLKIVETDPIVKQAKESAPFDKPFFLKIKRLSTGKQQDPLGTLTRKIDTTETNTIQGSKQENKSSLEERKYTIPNPKPNVAPSKIKQIDLIKLVQTSTETIFLAGNTYTSQIIFEEKDTSEFVYIKIDNLRPEHGYKLEITWDNGAPPEVYLFTTVAATLDKRLKNKISPQIGVASILFNEPTRLYAPPRLLVGAYYQIRPIDPDIPFKTYKALALQRFSAFLGLTFNTIADGYIREDLFGTSNLMLGIGYQPMDALRLNVGRLFFTSVGPNRLLAEQKTIDSTLYIAITLDVKLKDLLGGIITTLGFK